MTDPAATSATAAGPRSIAAGSIGTAITGDIITGNVILSADALASARDTPAPPGTNNLGPRPLCVGREDELAWLQRVLTADGGSAVTPVPVVHGLGGIGKTTLALYYAHCRRDDHILIWWINAESPARLEQSLAALAARLAPTWAAHAADQERITWALNWLHWHPGWLLVLDNAEDPRDLHPYLGSLTGGHLLITTRRATGWPRAVVTRALGTLAPDEAAALLCDHALHGAPPTPRQLLDARALAADLGHLPLALDQAGAYLAQNRTISIGAYRRKLAGKLDRAAEGTDAERTIARVWTQTLSALTTRAPLAIEVLHTLAWLAPDDIPVTLLRHLDDEDDSLAEALGALSSYSMIALTPETVSIHRLLQTVLRTAPGHPGRAHAEHALTTAFDALTEPPDHLPAPAPDPAWDALIPHLIALAAGTPPGHRDAPAIEHYDTAARYLHRRRHNARTIALREALLAHRERTLGSAHPSTLTGRDDLAYAHEVAGDIQRAIPLYESTLAQREQVLGDTHPETLRSRSHLAYAYRRAGDLERAVALFETTLAQREQVLGSTHPHTLRSRGDLAYAYRAAGDHERAVALFETTLTQHEQLFGETHPETLNSRTDLAYAYRRAGDLERAIALHETILAQREQVLGDMHPDTLATRSDLAYAYRRAGDLERAIALHESTLAQREQVLGSTHPHTLNSRTDLAFAYQTAGDLQGAIALFETTLTQHEQLFGDTYPDTLTSRNHLAYAYEVAGDYERAIALYESTLAQREQVLGDTHPDTLTSRRYLAQARAKRDKRLPRP
ncbi:FxSxx-COOH system tetratricopeptide repeat protein [Kitasatospora sp. NPDC050467]|uniref:FxSxx-COOH system tetratricopeptide repeat protein n=1 Tax=Kitasatospora sp. NPDC050467 TaxID=3364053 RepID=UPI0037AD0387